MKTIAYLLGLLCAAFCFAGETGISNLTAEGQPNQLACFDGLFLTNAPLRYQDCHSFLSWLDHESRLDAKEMLAICTKLKTFLSRRTARSLAPDCQLTGLAAPEAVLRAYAARLLGKHGTSDDIPFLQEFAMVDQSTLPDGLRYEVTRTICEDVIKRIQERNSANHTSDGISP